MDIYVIEKWLDRRIFFNWKIGVRIHTLRMIYADIQKFRKNFNQSRWVESFGKLLSPKAIFYTSWVEENLEVLHLKLSSWRANNFISIFHSPLSLYNKDFKNRVRIIIYVQSTMNDGKFVNKIEQNPPRVFKEYWRMRKTRQLK